MRKFFAVFLIAALAGVFGVAYRTQAASLSALSDVMTRVKKSEASSHDISFTLSGSNTFAAGESITVDFHEDDSDFSVAGSSSIAADFDFNDGTERTIVNVGVGSPSCSDGANNVAVGINDTTGVVTFQACTGYTASGSGATVNIEYGTAASGTNRVTNPGTAGTYVIDIDETTDDGSKIAAAILDDDQVVVSTTIDPYISLVLTDNAVSLVTSSDGNPSSTATGYNKNDTNTLAVATNGESGYSLTYAGSTLTRSGGSETITAIGGTPATSQTNSEQFGINLKNNTTPDVGANPSGGSGSASSDYNTADSYAFEAGTTPISLASASAASQTTTYTVSYIVNVDETTESGAYNTTITYIASGNF